MTQTNMSSSKETFIYVRAGDRVGATRTRFHVEQGEAVILALSRGGSMKLPEGREVMEFRKEHEDAGVDFKYRLTDFQDWFNNQDQDTVKKWLGTHPDSVYPEAPEGLFWQEWNEGGEWTVGLLSMEDGQPVNRHKKLVEEVREDLLKRSTGEEAEAAMAEEPEADEALPSEDSESEGEEEAGEEDAPEESDEE